MIAALSAHIILSLFEPNNVSFDHADRNICVSAGILLVKVKSVMNTRTKNKREA